MPDRGALVQDGAAGFFEFLDERARAGAGGLDDADAGRDYGVCVGGVVWRVYGGEQSEVDGEGVGG